MKSYFFSLLVLFSLLIPVDQSMAAAMSSEAGMMMADCSGNGEMTGCDMSEPAHCSEGCGVQAQCCNGVSAPLLVTFTTFGLDTQASLQELRIVLYQSQPPPLIYHPPI